MLRQALSRFLRLRREWLAVELDDTVVAEAEDRDELDAEESCVRFETLQSFMMNRSHEQELSVARERRVEWLRCERDAIDRASSAALEAVEVDERSWFDHREPIERDKIVTRFMLELCSLRLQSASLMREGFARVRVAHDENNARRDLIAQEQLHRQASQRKEAARIRRDAETSKQQNLVDQAPPIENDKPATEATKTTKNDAAAAAAIGSNAASAGAAPNVVDPASLIHVAGAEASERINIAHAEQDARTGLVARASHPKGALSSDTRDVVATDHQAQPAGVSQRIDHASQRTAVENDERLNRETMIASERMARQCAVDRTVMQISETRLRFGTASEEYSALRLIHERAESIAVVIACAAQINSDTSSSSAAQDAARAQDNAAAMAVAAAATQRDEFEVSETNLREAIRNAEVAARTALQRMQVGENESGARNSVLLLESNLRHNAIARSVIELAEASQRVEIATLKQQSHVSIQRAASVSQLESVECIQRRELTAVEVSSFNAIRAAASANRAIVVAVVDEASLRQLIATQQLESLIALAATCEAQERALIESSATHLINVQTQRLSTQVQAASTMRHLQDQETNHRSSIAANQTSGARLLSASHFSSVDQNSSFHSDVFDQEQLQRGSLLMFETQAFSGTTSWICDMWASVLHEQLRSILLRCQRQEFDKRCLLVNDESAAHFTNELVMLQVRSFASRQSVNHFDAGGEAVLRFHEFDPIVHSQARLADSGVQFDSNVKVDSLTPSRQFRDTGSQSSFVPQRQSENAVMQTALVATSNVGVMTVVNRNDDQKIFNGGNDRGMQQVALSRGGGGLIQPPSADQQQQQRAAATAVWVLATLLGARWAASRRTIIIEEDENAHCMFSALELLQQSLRKFAAFRGTAEVLFHEAALRFRFGNENGDVSDTSVAWDPYHSANDDLDSFSGNQHPTQVEYASRVFGRAIEMFLDLEKNRRVDLAKKWFGSLQSVRIKMLQAMTELCGERQAQPQLGAMIPKRRNDQENQQQQPSLQLHPRRVPTAATKRDVPIEIFDFRNAIQRPRQNNDEAQQLEPERNRPVHHRFLGDSGRRHLASQQQPIQQQHLFDEANNSNTNRATSSPVRFPRRENEAQQTPALSTIQRITSSVITSTNTDVEHRQEQEQSRPRAKSTSARKSSQRQLHHRLKFGLILSDGTWIGRHNFNNNASARPLFKSNSNDNDDDDNNNNNRSPLSQRGTKHEYGCLRVLISKPPAYPSIRTGDLILSIDGNRVTTNDDAERFLRRHAAAPVAEQQQREEQPQQQQPKEIPAPLVFEILRLHCDREETIHTVVIAPQ